MQAFGAEVAILACLACLASASELEEHLAMEFGELGHDHWLEVPEFLYHLEKFALGHEGGSGWEQRVDSAGWHLEEH